MLPAGTRPVVGVARQRLQTRAQGPRRAGEAQLARRAGPRGVPGRPGRAGPSLVASGLGPLSTPLR